jgi:hypothetical protein
VRYGLYLPVKSEQASSALLLPGVETEKYCQLFCVFRWGLVSWKGSCGFWVQGTRNVSCFRRRSQERSQLMMNY